ncbi:hypothetical protein LPB142_14280 [Rhodobacter xanthinilyticus]|uniref:ABC transmembrane type-1 domain-containing protein n=1 Tax=Rhodobacter xanthinilyticus TaxID=1850250 RepID=A0A1D9MEP9_9RHOB|nr:hypothetical protein LPB142_14280 [Rhodobacter xanthinilyticus]
MGAPHRAVRALIWALIGAPVLLGLAMTVAAACAPGALAAALAEPGLWASLRVTLITGLGATAVSLALTLPLGLWLVRQPRAGRALAPMLAVPHAALGLGLAFLFAPSGLVARGLAGPMGWAQPPQWAWPGDPWGGALLLGLVLKEAPFLLLMMLSAASQLDPARMMAAGQSLGRRPGAAFALGLWPQLYARLRLPVLIVLGYGLSNVDMALILGPSHPPTLAIRALRLYTAPDLRGAGPGAVLALGLVAVCAAAAALGWAVERGAARLGRGLVWRAGEPGRGAGPGRLAGLGAGLALALGALFWASVAMLVLWSLAGAWRFPALWPEGIGLGAWRRGGWLEAAGETLRLGLGVTAAAVLLAIALLEAESRSGRAPRLWLLLVPLLLPQIGFLQGLVSGFLWLGLPPGRAAVLWAEALFVFPYVYLTLAGPWRGLGRAEFDAAASLGAGPWRRLVRLRLPMLARPLAVAAAVGFSVSVAQYLAVLLPGGGRVATLTTEAVALASGADRRVAASYGLAQAVLPALGFVLAFLAPDRRGRR